jgi:ribosome-associated heat shock protein Hsp15
MGDNLRIDKWLWHARFCKTRSIAQRKALDGHIRLNGHRVEKPSVAVQIGDIVTLPAGGQIICIRIAALGLRRGPASEARTLYELISE